MGLMIHSLGEIPAQAERDYYLYVLDYYGWEEPIVDSLIKNFPQMADKASKTNSAVFRGTVGSHFSDEVLSWHNVNGLDGERFLPAILITTKNPHAFQGFHQEPSIHKDKLLLIPIKELCKTASDVVELINKIFSDIESKKALPDFAVARELKAGFSGAVVDALILEPNAFGMGINLKKIINFFSKKKAQ